MGTNCRNTLLKLQVKKPGYKHTQSMVPSYIYSDIVLEYLPIINSCIGSNVKHVDAFSDIHWIIF